MGQSFTTEKFSICDNYVSLFDWNKGKEAWELCSEIDEDVLVRLRGVLDMKRQMRDLNERVYGWGVDATFVPWKGEVVEETMKELFNCKNPFFRAIYTDPSGNLNRRDKVRIHRLCVLKKHLNEALQGETPQREEKRMAEIIAICTSWELNIKDVREELSAVSEITDL
jgi:hypothetical protein